MTRVIAFANGDLGAASLALLAPHLVGVVLNTPAKRRDEQKILAACPPGVPVFSGPCQPDLEGRLRALMPSHGLSVLFGHIFPLSIIGMFPCGIANLHPSLLPFGRGAHPNVWAIARREPAGVTLHLVDAGIDTGPILAQTQVAVAETDTGRSLYERLMLAGQQLLATAVPAWLEGRIVPRPQGEGPSPRRVADLDRQLSIDAATTYTGREVIDILRARTFAPHGTTYLADGRRFRVRIEIEEQL